MGGHSDRRRALTTHRAWTAALAVLFGVGAGPVVTGQALAAADPAGCGRTVASTGDTITCTNGIPAGSTLTGTDRGADQITVSGGEGRPVGAANWGTVDGGLPNPGDTCTIVHQGGQGAVANCDVVYKP